MALPAATSTFCLVDKLRLKNIETILVEKQALFRDESKVLLKIIVKVKNLISHIFSPFLFNALVLQAGGRT
jgi:hypothetical protein